MFEHYMHYQAVDPVRRKRLVVAAWISVITTTGLIMFMWIANKMNIARVDPPTISFLMVQMAADEPPPPPPPPPPPAAAQQEEEEVPEEEVPLEEDIVQPTETPDKIPEEKGKKVPQGVPGGVPGGIPGGVVGGVLGGQFKGGVATKRDTGKDVAKKPIKAVMGQAIYSPDPDKSKLAGTKAGMFDKRPGVNKTSFCVSATGKTVDVRTVKKFPGDPKVDQICRDTVKKWRFKPFVVGGKAQKTCSTVEFNIKFN